MYELPTTDSTSKMSTTINRLLSRREKHRGGNDGDGHKSRPVSGSLHSLFTSHDDGHASEKEKAELEKKHKEAKERLRRRGITNFTDEELSSALKSVYSGGLVSKTVEMMTLLEESKNGIVESYNPKVKLLGAVNRENVTCYLDATLFAMFARLEAFEAMLYNTFKDEERAKLGTLLRLWVNTLRTGRLVTVDITKQIQEALAACGWPEAAALQQQDASEAFSFLTDKLNLPMLTLKMDIHHAGKEDEKDDHRYVRERLLEVAIPEEQPGGGVIMLEHCLESYFNSRVEVKRYLQRRGTLNSMRSRMSVDSSKGGALHIETIEVDDSHPSTPIGNNPPPYSPIRPNIVKGRTASILQEYYVKEKGVVDEKDEDGLGPLHKQVSAMSEMGRIRAGSIRKEVMMPAWQIFSLIPWYTADTEGNDGNPPSSDEGVASHFSTKRPVLGICLKRYAVDANGHATRRNTHIDIPIEIKLPHFIQEDPNASGPGFGNFKLSLQSVICHRGTSVHTGHYISIVRGMSPANEAAGFPPGDSWLLFDDLAIKERIKEVNITKALQDESPYLLFYQVQPVEGDPGNIEELGRRPPSYMDSGVSGMSSTPPKASLEVTDPNFGTTRSSLEGSAQSSFSDAGPRGRTSATIDREPSFTYTDNSVGRTEANRKSFDITTRELPDPISPVDSAQVSRLGSTLGLVGRNPSQDGQAREDSRLSLSLSRVTGIFTKGKDKASPDDAAVEEEFSNERLLGVTGVSSSVTQVKEEKAEEEEKKLSSSPGKEKGKLKKESKADKKEREKSKNRLSSGPNFLQKRGNGDRSREGECVVM